MHQAHREGWNGLAKDSPATQHPIALPAKIPSSSAHDTRERERERERISYISLQHPRITGDAVTTQVMQ